MFNLPEAGLFLFCLNHAWINDGLPEAPEDIARALKVPLKDFSRYWPRVSVCFSSNGQGRLKNKRQEEERAEAILLSIRNTKNIRKRYEKSTTVEDSKVFGSTTRAMDLTLSNSLDSKKEILLPKGIVSQKFDAFWDRWVELTRRAQRKSFACQAFVSVVEQDTEADCLACLERYGESDEVKQGIITNADRWIYDQARDGFKGAWQPRAEKKSNGGIAGYFEEYLNEHPD